MNLNELDALLAGLRNRHKSWRIWYVPRATAGPEWHAFREPVLTAATAEELEGYRRFVMTLAKKVADAHREGGESESPPESDAIHEIAVALGVPDSAASPSGSGQS